MIADIKHKLGRSLGTDFYLIDELLTEEERGIRDKVRAFCDKEVIPIINDCWERAEVPFELIPKIAALRIAGGSTCRRQFLCRLRCHLTLNHDLHRDARFRGTEAALASANGAA